MKISFLITHYNRPDDLFECISSIRKLEIANSEIIEFSCFLNKSNEELSKFRKLSLNTG